MFSSGGGSVLMLHTVQVEVHMEQVPYASQHHRYHDMSPLGSESSIILSPYNLFLLPKVFPRWDLLLLLP